MKKELSKQYQPQASEREIYQYWQDNNYFRAEVSADKKPFTIVMPPPNITGQLHMGHALDNVLQDTLIRHKRMQGYAALWLPGTDHASIATETKIVEDMAKEGLTKQMLGREKFLERAWQWKEQYAGRIVEQLKVLGSSCDWSRLRFTMDEGCSKAVREVFVKYYQEDIIYRGNRIINWCPCCKTSISEIEVEYEERDSHLWRLRYQIKDSDEYLELDTSRPETMLGDTAVAVNPEDPRYQKYIGKTVILPLLNKEIPVVADSYVEMDFGTGVVKITPAHDPNDFEVGLRHDLPIVDVMTDDAHIAEGYAPFSGMDMPTARKAIVEALDKAGALVRIEDYTHNVGTCYRCHSTIEPKVSDQWFVRMDRLAQPAIDAVKSGETNFIPDRFAKIYFHWLENLHDWCISRQLWWGHRIPAWYCDDCGEISVSMDDISHCAHCGSGNIRQDEDTLDTWFSSALWPFSTLGWPEDTADLDYFYPTDVLVTGYDIIFFWVVRMMFSGCKHMGKAPFHTVLIHGLVRDGEGRKMSKSLGNGIDPLQVVEEYGADALRFALLNGTAPGNDLRFSTERLLAARNFTNKIWNACRYVMMNLPESFSYQGLPANLRLEDKWILSRFNSLVQEVNENYEKCETGLIAKSCYEFFWDLYCDWYIEITKPRITNEETRDDVQQVLVYLLRGLLKLLHPMVPFITETLWQSLVDEASPLMLEPYPSADPALSFPAEEAAFAQIIDTVTAIRIKRAEMDIKTSVKTQLFIETAAVELYQSCLHVFDRIATEIHVAEAFTELEMEVTTVVSQAARVFLPTDELADKEKELARLNQEKKLLENEIAALSAKLANTGFTSKAPAAVVAEKQEKLAAKQQKLTMVLQSIQEMQA